MLIPDIVSVLLFGPVLAYHGPAVSGCSSEHRSCRVRSVAAGVWRGRPRRTAIGDVGRHGWIRQVLDGAVELERGGERGPDYIQLWVELPGVRTMEPQGAEILFLDPRCCYVSAPFSFIHEIMSCSSTTSLASCHSP
jgi:hypothetical protein